MGISFGLFLKIYPQWSLYNTFLEANVIIGQLFINSLKMILVPLVFFSIVVGVSNLGNSKKSSTIWKYTLLYFFSTMSLAIFTALIIMNLVKPGIGITVDSWPEAKNAITSSLSIMEFLKQVIVCKSFSITIFRKYPSSHYFFYFNRS